jgi:UDP-N-acetylmuramoyl-L-alanyl-D-glutamate--2,6-diaminopimelate ligase
MRLDELTGALAGAGTIAEGEAGTAVQIAGLAYDSRAVDPGDLFFCVSGFRTDGHDFAPEAVRAGAAALVVERPLGLGVPEVLVASARDAMAPIAAHFYGHPARELKVVAVTGTNGKTTTAYLLRELLEAAGERCGLLGTVKSVIGGRDLPVQRTTPEAIDLQADLRAMVDGGDSACAIEVSSHALELGRAAAIGFAAAVFTNLTQDHLDFHPTMEDYFQAKRRLFLPAAGERPSCGPPDPAPAISAINLDDVYGRRLAGEVDGAVTFALDAPADYRASDLSCQLDGCRFVLDTPDGRREVALPMPGRFNVSNALGALSAAHALGFDLDVLVGALARGVRVPGRFEPVDQGQRFAVLVDYAHTPDSLENVLRAARELIAVAGAGEGRVLCVFGAGGDRDRAKRPLMGEIAARLADVAIVTSDNPRSEDPQRIIEEIMVGVGGAGGELASYPAFGGPRGAATARVRSLVDRRAAIQEAICAAREGDVVVIAGKGHEQGQEFADGRKLPFDDVAVAREALIAAVGARGGAGGGADVEAVTAAGETPPKRVGRAGAR